MPPRPTRRRTTKAATPGFYPSQKAVSALQGLLLRVVLLLGVQGGVEVVLGRLDLRFVARLRGPPRRRCRVRSRRNRGVGMVGLPAHRAR